MIPKRAYRKVRTARKTKGGHFIMTNIKEILRLEGLGINHAQIAGNVRCTRQTVITILRKANELGIRYSDVAEMTNKEVAKKLVGSEVKRIQFKMPDFEWVSKELRKSGVTLNLLWVEYCEQCRLNGDMPYQVTQFKKYYSEYAVRNGATMHIDRKPGETLEVDWVGGSVDIVDSDTGEIMDAYVFVGALSYSGYAYVEAFWTMTEEDWIKAHVNAYEFFGGVTRILVPDNLKTGIDKNTKTETVVNKAYQELSEHYGTAVIPARVRAPNDKPNAEGAVKTTQMWILAALRNRRFFSLGELNNEIREKLTEYNSRPFQRYDGSRESRYLEEREFLLPLPKYPFELSEWSFATVAKDYHVRCGPKYYSVPHEYIGKRVDIRIGRDVVEVFYDGLRVCSHRKDISPKKYVTDPAHMPAEHQKHAEWNGERFRNWAKNIGPQTSAVVECFLSNVRIEQQAYKTCNALLHLSGKYSRDKLEAACDRVLGFTSRPSYKAVESVLRSGSELPDKKDADDKKAAAVEHGFIRGASYYGGGGDGNA
jgi:transposase